MLWFMVVKALNIMWSQVSHQLYLIGVFDALNHGCFAERVHHLNNHFHQVDFFGSLIEMQDQASINLHDIKVVVGEDGHAVETGSEVVESYLIT